MISIPENGLRAGPFLARGSLGRCTGELGGHDGTQRRDIRTDCRAANGGHFGIGSIVGDMITERPLTLEERRTHMPAIRSAMRMSRQLVTLRRELAPSTTVALAVPSTSTLLRMGRPDTAQLITDAALPRALRERISRSQLERVHRVFHAVHAHRLRESEARRWLRDDIDPATPRAVHGLAAALPDQRRQVVAEAEADEQTRAGLRYRHRCAADSPGRLVTARRRVPRGPNTRLLTFSCQQAR